MCVQSIPFVGSVDLPNESPLQSLTALSMYRHPLVGGLIRSFKYQRAVCLEEEAFFRVAKRFAMEHTLQTPSMIVPLAMDPERERIRGMDHALQLALVVQRALFPDVPVIQLLSRTRHTETNAQLDSAAARAANVRDVFAVDKSLTRQRILLVDDVFTTGATIYEAAKTLQKNTPDLSVDAFVFALSEASK